MAYVVGGALGGATPPGYKSYEHAKAQNILAFQELEVLHEGNDR